MLTRIAAGAAFGLAVTRLSQHLVDRPEWGLHQSAGAVLVRAKTGSFPNSPGGAARAATRAIPALGSRNPPHALSTHTTDADAEQMRHDVLHHALRVPVGIGRS